MSGDRLQRLLFEELDVRGVAVSLDSVYREVLARSGYPSAVAGLIGEALLVVALLSSGIKFSGRISLQLRSEGPIRLLLADCTDQGGMRAIAHFDEDAPGLAADQSFVDLVTGATLSLTLEPERAGRRWQGIVPVEGGSLAEAVTAYFGRSEQLPTRLKLAVSGQRAAALMVQKLPGEGEDDDGWHRLGLLLDTLGENELLDNPPEVVLHRLFHEESRRLFEPRQLFFHCPCSRDRVARVLISLGREELADMLKERSPIEVRCEFCNQAYLFDAVDVEALEHGDVLDQDDTVH